MAVSKRLTISLYLLVLGYVVLFPEFLIKFSSRVTSSPMPHAGFTNDGGLNVLYYTN